MDNNKTFAKIRMVPWRLGQLHFRNKKEMQQHVSKYLADSIPNRAVPEEDLLWVSDLLQMHPRFEEKRKDSQGIFVINTGFGNHCLAFKKPDGSYEDVGTSKIFYEHTRTLKSQANRALRNCVRPQIDKFRSDTFKDGPAICEITQKVLYDDEETHIDHHFEILPFKSLVQNFLRIEGKRLEEIPVVSDGTQGHKLADEGIHSRFFRYHEANALLRAIHRSGNLRSAQTA